jgi:poly-gamma-glutamate capsule biosynthesis protein CapA/YwtB (metallophosphatase superfamily)
MPDHHLTFFLCGDVMTGRGIDQILPNPGDPTLHEPCTKSSLEYVKLAEQANGPIGWPVDFSYIWGDALEVFQREKPQAKIINLETAITRNDVHWRGKDIHYKMSPENVGCLTSAGIDCCILANNHMLDWGIPGLLESLTTLDQARIKHAGAGLNLREAQQPATLPIREASRVIVFSLGSTTSGIPTAWSAEEDRPGLYVIETQGNDSIRALARQIDDVKQSGDIVIASIHWGGNWGYKIPSNQKEFAHRLVDEARVDIVHGHSSHHVKAIEVYNERLILYGCGDFFNDYEGISGYEDFRGDLALMYFAELNPATGELLALRMIPTQVRRFRVKLACKTDSQWLEALLNREGKRFCTGVTLGAENALNLCWE